MSLFTTANGKGVSTFIDPKTAHVRIKFDQGGELPEKMQGLFTSVRAAEQAITSYLLSDKPADKKSTVKG